ncbi:MAG: hypothetical protein KF799_01040 [Bdellovibrionales bacterium]|nr:hypothetical protein [Bdellovibrionales bacterium]
MRNSLWILSFLFICACGMKPSTKALSPDVEPHVRTDERNISAAGQWQFIRPLRGLTSREHFVIEAQFLQPQASFTLHSHFNGFAWRDGMRIRFTRDGDKLSMGISAPDLAEKTFDLPADWMGLDGRLRLRLEVHNSGAGGPRVLVWKATQSLQGEIEQPRPFISAANADFDSQAEKLIFQTHGRGVLWGVEFANTRMLKIYGEAPYAH